MRDDKTTGVAVERIGPPLVFERLWEETGCRAVLEELAAGRGHQFALERAVFLTVLHRLMGGGSDLAAERWREDYAIAGMDGIELHHLYRTMAWLGEAVPEPDQDDATAFAPRCVKDMVEERLLARRRDLFSSLDLVLADTAPFVPPTIAGRDKDTDDGAKAVEVAGTRYIVCLNHEQARKDAADRALIVESLQRQLKKADMALVGNTGYRRFLRTAGDGRFAVDRARIEGHLRPHHQHRPRPAAGHAALQAIVGGGADLPHGQASSGHAADLDSLTRTEVEQDGKRFFVRSAPSICRSKPC